MACIDCGKPAKFGENGKLPLFCKLHRQAWTVDTSKQCEIPGCSNIATHGVKSKPTCCEDHKDNKMVKSKQFCEEKNCSVSASFGLLCATHCISHKSQAMTNLTKLFCKAEKCNRIPAYRSNGSLRINLCSVHKEEELANKCGAPGCNNSACFGYAVFNILNFRPEFCQEHKPDFMLVAKPRAEKPTITRTGVRSRKRKLE